MKRDLDKTRQALIDAAEKLITSCSDPAEVTSRAITQEAGVNIAMINYCFGSREQLLFEVLERVSKKAQDTVPSLSMLKDAGVSPKHKLAEIHFQTMKMMLENFKLCSALTKYVLINRKIGDKRTSVAFIQQHFGDRKTEGECRMIAFELSILHELAVLHHQEIRDDCGIDLLNDDVLRRYVYENVDRFLGE